MGLAARVISLIVMLAASQGGLAQIVINGAGFDPRPVDIPVSSERTHTRPITSMDLLTIRDLHGVQISPDGKYVAFVVGQAVHETNSYRSGLFVVSTAGNERAISLGTAGPPHLDAINEWIDDPPQWSKDSSSLYYRMKSSGTWQVWKWTLAGNPPVQMTRAERDVEDFHLTPDGMQLVFNAALPAFTAPELKSISEHGILYDGGIRAWQSQPFLNELLETKHKLPETWVHDLRNDEEHKATTDEVKELGPWESDLPEKVFDPRAANSFEGHHIVKAKISPDGRSVAFLQYFEDVSHGARTSCELLSKAVRGGKAISLTPGAFVFDNYWWSSDSKRIFYTETKGDGHSRKLMVVSAEGGTPREALSATQGSWLDDFSADNASKLIACTREDSNTPAQVALADASTGDLRILVDPNPEFHNLQLSKSWRLDVSNKYGDSFHGHVVLPLNYAQGKRYPLVIVTYVDGDCFLRGGVGDEYPIQVLAASGFVVLQISSGRDRTFKPGDFETAMLRWESPVEAMKIAVQRLTDMGTIDSTRVAITGLSYGSELVHYAISHAKFVQTAIASGPGGWDPYIFYMADNGLKKALWNWGLDGWPEGNSSARWHRVSTELAADQIEAPLLINAADTEYLEGLNLVGAMQALSKPLEVFVYPNELHQKNQPTHRYEIYERNVDWLKFWLLGEEDTNPSKEQQYQRWHELRRVAAKATTEKTQ